MLFKRVCQSDSLRLARMELLPGEACGSELPMSELSQR